MTRSDLQLVNASQSRRILGATVAVMTLLVVLAFGAGILAANHLRPFEEGAELGRSQSDTEKVAMKRLGELFGRVLRLENDAAYLVKKVGHHEQVARKLKNIDPALAPGSSKPARAGGTAARRPAAAQEGQGGVLLAPRGCSTTVPQRIDLHHIAAVENSIDCLQGLFEKMENEVALRSAGLMTIPSLHPVRNARIGSGFGNRVDPFHRSIAFHSGLDFASPQGTAIHAAAGGRVLSAGWRGPYGNMVEIDHGNGLVTRYAHASKILVKAQDVVMPGQLIAQVGSTGRSTGPHLHFEVLHRGEFVDPEIFMALGDLKLADNDQAQD